MTLAAPPTKYRLLAVALVAGMVLCAWSAVFDAHANAHVDAGLKRAAATYAAARLLNGVISVVQGTGIAASPAGIGMTFAPGEILDPLNDLVEQFSQVMLIAMVAFGVQKVLLTVGASWIVSLVLSATAAAWSVFVMRSMPVPRLLGRVLLVLLVARFAMPVALIGADAVFQRFLAPDYQQSQAALAATQGEASAQAGAGPGGAQSFWSQLRQSSAEALSEARAGLDRLKADAENAVERIVTLMVIFALETVVLPLIFLWGWIYLCRSAFESPAGRPAP